MYGHCIEDNLFARFAIYSHNIGVLEIPAIFVSHDSIPLSPLSSVRSSLGVLLQGAFMESCGGIGISSLCIVDPSMSLKKAGSSVLEAPIMSAHFNTAFQELPGHCSNMYKSGICSQLGQVRNM